MVKFGEGFGVADELEQLEEEITTLAAEIHAATHHLLVLLAEFDRRQGWKPAGHASCAAWLHFRTGIDLGACREKVRAARALDAMPAVSAAMARGELSFSKVRALTRLSGVVEGEDEEVLVDFARQVTASELEKRVRGWKLGSRADEIELERRRHALRGLSVFPGDDGLYVIQGRLDPEVGALLMRAIEAAADALHRDGETWAAEGGMRGPRGEEVTPKQRRADALGLLAERALAAGFAELAGSERESTAPISGTRAERYQVLLHVGAETLREDAEAGCSHLDDGMRVSAETSRRLCCDASVVEVVSALDDNRATDRTGPVCRMGRPAYRMGPADMMRDSNSILNIGRRTRTIPPALRRALELRDGGCRFPGCSLRFTEAHHIVHWADGGETRLDNLILLCRHHHRALHEEGFRVRLSPDGKPRFFDRAGWPLPDCAPPPPALGPDPVGTLRGRLRKRGVVPNGWTCSSRYEGSRDIPWDLEARANDAVDR